MLSSRSRGFATGRSKSPTRACRTQCSQRWRRACMTAALGPVANYSQPIDPQPDALPMSNQTEKTLGQVRTAVDDVSAADWVSYSYLVDWLRDTDVASQA